MYTADLIVRRKLRACQADAAYRLAAHLRQTGKYVFNPSPWAFDTLVASLVPLADGLAGLPFALNMRAPSIELEPVLAWLVVIATVSLEVTAAAPSIQYINQVKCVGLAGIAHPHVADQFVLAIHADRQLVAEIRLAMLLRSARLDILLSALGRLPLDGRCSLLHDLLFFSRVVRSRGADDAGIDDLPFACGEAIKLQLAPNFIKNQMLDLGLNEPLTKIPDRIAIRHARSVL